MNEKEITKSTYDNNAKQISERFASYFSLYRLQIITKFLNYLPSSPSILDIGCGSGDATQYIKLALPNSSVVGVDISLEMLKEARKKDVSIVQMDMDSLAFPPNSFDAIWAMNSLLHLPKKSIPSVLQQISDVLKQDGLLFISIKKGHGERFVISPEQENRFYSFWQKDEFYQQAEKYFKLVDFVETNREDHFFLNFYMRKQLETRPCGTCQGTGEITLPDDSRK